VWDEGVEGAVRAAFLGTGRPYAEAITTRTLALLDRYASAYASMRTEVCEAGRAGKQSAAVVGLREACLERRRARLQALTTLFAEKPDPQVLDHAVEAAQGLYPVDYCADTESLTARVSPPEDPTLRAKVAMLQPRVDRLDVLQNAGKFKEGLALGEALTAEAAEIPYAPLRAQFQLYMGTLRDEIGDYAAAKDLLRRATVSALEGRDDVIAANAWGLLLFVVSEHQQRPDEAEILRALSPVVVRTRDERALGTWLNMEGGSLVRAGKYAEARDHMERALAALDKAGDPEDLEVAAVCNNLGNALNRLGERQKARAALERSLAIFAKVFGPEHPRVAAALNNLGNMIQPLGDHAQARAHFERALAIWTKAQGPDHPLVAFATYNLGSVLYDQGDDRGAAEHCERALAILEKSLGPDHVMVSWPLEGLGRARTRLGQLDAALPLLERALALREKGQGASSPELAGALLALGELSLARRQPVRAVPLLERALGLHNPDRGPEVELALAEALWQVGEDRARARTLAEDARAAYERLGHRPGMEHASRWLADHPG
jgi:serine/threonine-protein kinase